MRTADASASYAAEVAQMLWPPPWSAPRVSRRPGRRGVHDRDAFVLPSSRRPRLLVPVDVPAAACLVRRAGGGSSSGASLRALLGRAVHSPAFRLLGWPVLRVPGSDAGADSIERHLGEWLGRPVRVGVLLGTRRVNQKPVLAVFDLDGGLHGYAKIGHNELTKELVRREADALARIAEHRLTSLRVPRVLHHAPWRALEVLVVSPLSTDPAEPVPPATRVGAMNELARLEGVTERPLVASSFWQRLTDGAQRLSGVAGADRLAAAIRETHARHGEDVVRLGGWHGDWGHWNMGMGEGVLNVWDWERYDPDVPLGFDALHFTAQPVRPGSRDAAQQEREFLRSVPRVLTDAGVAPAHHQLTLRLYLLEVAVRYVEALTHGSTPALRTRTSWVLSLLGPSGRPLLGTTSEGRP